MHRVNPIKLPTGSGSRAKPDTARVGDFSFATVHSAVSSENPFSLSRWYRKLPWSSISRCTYAARTPRLTRRRVLLCRCSGPCAQTRFGSGSTSTAPASRSCSRCGRSSACTAGRERTSTSPGAPSTASSSAPESESGGAARRGKGATVTGAGGDSGRECVCGFSDGNVCVFIA